MPNPKRRHSRSRRDKRRTHDSLAVRSSSVCPQCGVNVLPHRVCKECGYYKGRQVIDVSDE